MRFKVLSAGICMGLGLMALAPICFAQAQTPQAGQKIQFSAPSNPTVASNLSQLNPRQNTLKQVEDDLFKPFKTRDPFQPDIFPKPQLFAPPTMDKRTQEMLDRRRNWAFADINDMNSDLSMNQQEDNTMDGKDQKPVSAIQRYLERLGNKPFSVTNKVNVTAWFMENLSGTNVLTSPESMTVEGQMMKMIKAAIAPRQSDGGFNDVVDFRHGNFKALTATQIEDQKRRAEEFQQLLNAHSPAAQVSPVNAVNPILPGQQAIGLPTNPFGTQGTAPLHRSLTPGGPIDPASKAFYSHVYDDPTSVALGQTNNLLSPRPAPAPLTQLPEPSDPFPKRKF